MNCGQYHLALGIIKGSLMVMILGSITLGVCAADGPTNKVPLLVLTNVTEQTWPMISLKITELRAKRCEEEEANYDPNNRGRMGPELLPEYHRNHDEMIRREMIEVEKALVNRFDADHDGELSDKELVIPMAAYRDLEKEKINSARWRMKRYLVKVSIVDVDGDGVVSSGEDNVAERVEAMARRQSLGDDGRARFLDLHELRKQQEVECPKTPSVGTVVTNIILNGDEQ